MLKAFHTINESSQLSGSGGVNWDGQTFTPWTSYSCNRIDLKLWRLGSVGNVTVSIRATDSGLPTDGDLASATVPQSSISDASPGSFVVFNLSSAVSLTAGTRYAIVLRSDAGILYMRISSGTKYAYGQHVLSANSGSDWIKPASANLNDLVFKTYDSSTYDPQQFFVGGAVSGGKHLWEVQDDGVSLTTVDSWALAGEVVALAFSSASRKLYIAIGTSVYCYDVDTMNLDTSWGSSGSIAVGATVNGIDVDSSDYLAIAHNVTDTNKRVSLYDDTGTLVWRSTVFGTNTQGRKVSFNLGGDINACTLGGNTGTWIAALLKRSDGTLSVGYKTRPSEGYNGDAIVSHGDTESRCLYTHSSFGSSSILLMDGAATTWQKAIAGANVQDVIHVNGNDLVIVADGSSLRSYYDVDGQTHPWADYSPDVNSQGTSITELGFNDKKEIYLTLTNGYVVVGNYNLSQRLNTQISTAALNSVVWTGDAYTVPTISDESVSAKVDPGSQASFYVTADGTPTPTYQWYKNDVALSGETSSTFTKYVTVADAGTYKCTVSNIAGDIDSSDMILTIPATNPYHWNP